jgi:membrane protease YdiL (CAAX protease family)
VAIAAVQLLALGVSLRLRLVEVPPEFAVDLSPATLLLLFLLALPLVAVVASLLLLVSGRSKSYREFQVLFFPVFLLFLVPASAAFLPAVELRSAVLLAPVANLCVGLREVFEGTIDLPALAVAWLVSAAAAVGVGRLTLRALASERLVLSAHLDAARFRGGRELFPRHVLPWFGGMWALLFVAAANIPSLGMDGQLLLNLVVIFLGGSLLMLRVYRLDSREVLRLESPNPAVWPAVVLGAPAFFLVALQLARLSGWLFPIPEEALEQYAQLTDSSARPLWELLLLVAVLPGICEEIAFRGVLLHGLRQRLRPFWACLLVGVIFAAFHIDMVRLLSTAVLGVLLAALTLRTGSIYPAMLWHALNNASAILASHFEISLESLGPSVYGPAVLVSALCLLWIWRRGAPAEVGGARPSDPG